VYGKAFDVFITLKNLQFYKNYNDHGMDGAARIELMVLLWGALGTVQE
jgi:hypothetical protein